MLRSIAGYIIFLLIALWICDVDNNERNSKKSKIVIYGIIFQIIIVFALTNLPILMNAIKYIAAGFMKLRDATLEGSKFVFGYLCGGEQPFEPKEGISSFIFAFQAAPMVILVGTLSAILTYLKILPFLARIIGSAFKYVFKIDESIGMVAASKIFIGQLEAPLLIKHRLSTLPKSDMFIILALAFATSSSAVMPIYASALEPIFPDAMKHIVMSSVVSVISVLIICSIAMPNKESHLNNINNNNNNSINNPYSSFMSAMSKGLSDGIFVWWCIVGTLIGMIALIAILNYTLALLPDYGGLPITLQRIFGIFMYPFAWLIGIQNSDLSAISQILGTKIVLNETIAFFDLAKANVSSESVVRTIYAINNFGNFSCIGITVGGLTALSPNQANNITALAGKSFIAGLAATGLTATLMNIFLSF